jgi:hypothetical protein
MTDKPTDPTDPTDSNPTTRFDPPEPAPSAVGSPPVAPPPAALQPTAPPPAAPPPAAPPVAPAEPPPPSQPWPPPSWRRGEDSGRIGTIVFGAILLVIGLWFFADQTLGLDMPNLRWSQLWPILLIGLGAWIAIGSMRRR